jgi:adenylosuccinate synthase
MAITVLLGAQWGDEGKGRITDALAHSADIVARYNGGDNAGHSINIGNKTVKLHLIPSGIFRPNCLNVMGNGVVVNPLNLLKEIAEVRAAGIAVGHENVKISDAAHVITAGHIALDKAREMGSGGIGTTQRGIGFAYMDKAARTGIRAGAMHNPEDFGTVVKRHVESVNRHIQQNYGVIADKLALNADQCAADAVEAAMQLRPYLANTFEILQDALDAGKNILAEGAQAALLDLDHGNYPYVTSSNATIGGVLTGLGVPPKSISRVVGVAKAFCSRVGAGPFPSELLGEMAVRLRGTGANPWDEYGSTTGRPRRVGWHDAFALRHAVRLNGIEEIALTKLDVLSGMSEIQLCVGYTYSGQPLRSYPQDMQVLTDCKPMLEPMSGWSEDVSDARAYADLPANLRAYVEHIEALSGAKVSMVSVGAEREQMMWR